MLSIWEGCVLGGGGYGELIKCGGYVQSSVVSVWQEMWTWLCSAQETLEEFCVEPFSCRFIVLLRFRLTCLISGNDLCHEEQVTQLLFIVYTFDIHLHHIPSKSSADGTMSTRLLMKLFFLPPSALKALITQAKNVFKDMWFPNFYLIFPSICVTELISGTHMQVSMQKL